MAERLTSCGNNLGDHPKQHATEVCSYQYMVDRKR